jgi:EAL domain-containing protein (putative c-di-GMP-specific phosphodiesterase class I)
MSGRSPIEPKARGEQQADGSCPRQGDEGAPCWRHVTLARIFNFALLRRHFGRDGAERLTSHLAGRATTALPGSRVVVAGRDLLEISSEAKEKAAIDAEIDMLVRLFAEPLSIDDERYDADIRFGTAVVELPAADEVRLIEQAEQALVETTAERRAVLIDSAVTEARVDRIALMRDLEWAIERGGLFLQYQPKLHVREQRIASVEALIRWRHPERGLVLPGDFIPCAEESRVIGPLTLWTIRQAIADQTTLTDHGHDLRVFVNLAGTLLGDREFIDQACALICSANAKIGFEITETSVIRDPEAAIAHLDIFAEAGIDIAIDDYGAGLSSLAYLKRLPARELKIDKLFVTQLTSSNRDPLIVRSTIDLAHALEMEVVAEGVETQAALALLSVMGCDLVQGFLISRPIDLEALMSFLEEGRHTATIQDTRATFDRLARTWRRA